MATYTEALQKLYVAYFNRPADVAGLAYWESVVEKAGGDTSAVSGAFAASQEYKDTYAGMTNLEIVNKVYNNLFGHDGDTEGLVFWVTQLNNKVINIDNVVAAIAAGAEGNTDGDAYAAKVEAATSFTTAMDTSAELLAYETVKGQQAGKDFITSVTADNVESIVADIDTSVQTMVDNGKIVPTPQTFNLSLGVDNVAGGAGDDAINGQYAPAANGGNTLSGLDSIAGGAGADTLTINDVTGGTAALAGVSVSGVETINLASTGAADIDTSTNGNVTGVTALNIVQGSSATVTVDSTTAVTVAGVTGAATVDGGASQTVTATGALTLSGSVGAIVATDSAQGANGITIDDGTSVTLTNTATNPGGTTGTIDVGTTSAPTGAVVITQHLTNAAAAASNTAGGIITVDGGTTVSVTETAVQGVKTTASTNSTLTQSAVHVNGTAATTSVTVVEAAAVTAANTVLAVAGSTETASVQFAALTIGETVTLGGLTLTADAAMTAKQVAAAFANLSDTALTGWTSGAVSGTGSDTVVFTSTDSGDVADLADTGTGNTTITETDGVDAVSAAGKGGVALGAVAVADGGTGSIATVSLTNYAAGSTINSKGLNSLTLSGKSGTLGLTHTAQTTLDLTLNKLSGTNTITDSSNGYTTVKIHTTGADSTLAGFADTAATSLVVDGSNNLELTSAAGLTTLKSITVSGAAGLVVDAGLAATVTAVDASATSGSVELALGSGATFTGGSGDDMLTIAAAPTKAIAGGAGNDTLVLNVAAATFSNASGNTNISGFETLGLGAAATGSYDATGFTHLTEGAVTAATAFINVAAGVDLTLTDTPGFGVTYTLKDATGTSDAFTLHLDGSAAAITATVTASGIENVTIDATSDAHTLTLVDTAAKTIVITGDGDLDLTSTGNVAVTSVDASASDGGLTYTAAGTVAETIKGGAGMNVLSAAAGATTADVLIGGAANDVLTANKGLDMLTGNGGNDKFVIVASSNVNSYATITDANAGDVVQLVDKGVETFSAAKIALAGTAVFQDYANAAVNAGGDAHTNGSIAWFQFGGDTYIVESMHDATATHDFQNGTDAIVKLTGLVDLSTATMFQDGANPGVNPLIVLH